MSELPIKNKLSVYGIRKKPTSPILKKVMSVLWFMLKWRTKSTADPVNTKKLRVEIPNTDSPDHFHK